MQYCSLQHQTLFLSPVPSTTGYCFFFGSIPSFFLELFPLWFQLIGHLLTWGVPLSVSYHFAFLYCSWGSQGKNTEVVCHSFLQWTTFCQTSPPWTDHLGWPHMAWLSFIDKTVVCVIRLANFFVIMVLMGLPSDALWQHLCLTWVSLPLDMGFSSRLLQQSAAITPYLGWGYLSELK